MRDQDYSGPPEAPKSRTFRQTAGNSCCHGHVTTASPRVSPKGAASWPERRPLRHCHYRSCGVRGARGVAPQRAASVLLMVAFVMNGNVSASRAAGTIRCGWSRPGILANVCRRPYKPRPHLPFMFSPRCTARNHDETEPLPPPPGFCSSSAALRLI